MSTFEKSGLTTTEQHKTPSAEVYAEFYAKYGAGALAVSAEYAGFKPLLEGRILHINGVDGVGGFRDDRSIHLSLFSTDSEGLKTSQSHVDTHGDAYRRYNYDPRAFTAFATDGVKTQVWQPSAAYGIHRGSVNAIDQPYHAENETLHLDFGQGYQPLVQISFDRIGGEGTVRFSTGLMAWILTAEESAPERLRALQPPSMRSETPLVVA